MTTPELVTAARDIASLDDADLLTRFADDVLQEQHLRPPSTAQLRVRFGEWIEQHRSAICGSNRVRQAIEDNADEHYLAAAVADALGGSGFVTAGVMATRLGIARLCAGEWATEDS